MRKKSISILDEPFDKVVQLYAQKIAVDKSNNMRLRTRLLKSHPELFNKEIFAEIEATIKIAVKAAKNHQLAGKVIHFDFRKAEQAINS